MPDTAGETNVPISEWTTGTLKVYEDEKISSLKLLMDERKEHQAELRLADQRAIDTALIANEKRLDALNELRQGVATTAQIEALEKIVNALSKLVYIGVGGVLVLQIGLQFFT